MSEVISIQPEGMPTGYDMFSRIEVTEDSEKIKRINGILELGEGEDKIERKVLLPDLEKIWGIDSSEWENYQADPEGWERDLKLNELTERVKRLEAQFASLVARNTELEEENIKKDTRITELEGLLKAGDSQTTDSKSPPEQTDSSSPSPADKSAPKESETLTVPPVGFEPGDRFKVRIPNREVEEVTIISVPSKENDSEQYRIKTVSGDDIFTPTEEELREWRANADSPASSPIIESVTDEPALNRWQRLRNRLMAPIYGGSTRLMATRTRYEYNDDGVAVGAVEEREDRRMNPLVAAMIGAGAVGLWWLLESKTGGHHGHDVINNYYNSQPGSGGSVGPSSIGGGSHHGAAQGIFGNRNFTGRHTDFFNAAPGRPITSTAVELPRNLHLGHVSGHEVIVDNHSNTVVNHVDGGSITDRQGNLSRRARTILRAKGYILRQMPFGNRYETAVYN